MKLTFEHHDTTYVAALANAKSIAITLDFEGPQPNHFGTDSASTSVLQLGQFIGDTSQGGSCNVDSLRMIPHCNGTHTETVGHIVNEEIWVGHAATDLLTLAVLITVQPLSAQVHQKEQFAGKPDSYRPALESGDSIITESQLALALASIGEMNQIRPESLIIRTLPNDNDKCSRAYTAKNSPPFLTVDSMKAINALGIRHLLVDFPSVDRMYDDGLLTNHHLYWNVTEQSHELSAETRQDKTITEMVYVDDEIVDGPYLLNLQVPAFGSDAAPSRPVIIPVNPIR